MRFKSAVSFEIVYLFTGLPTNLEFDNLGLKNLAENTENLEETFQKKLATL